MANERVHVVVVQLAGFLVLFLGIVAVFALARALTDRAFAASPAMFTPPGRWGRWMATGEAWSSSRRRRRLRTEVAPAREGLLKGVARGEEDLLPRDSAAR